MVQHIEAFVALDVAKLRNAVAIADGGRDGEVRYHPGLQRPGEEREADCQNNYQPVNRYPN
jgi:hypothetical protein